MDDTNDLFPTTHEILKTSNLGKHNNKSSHWMKKKYRSKTIKDKQFSSSRHQNIKYSHGSKHKLKRTTNNNNNNRKTKLVMLKIAVFNFECVEWL